MNFVGIDVKGDRLAQGGRAARELELSNTAFLRIHMQEIEAHFAENEVDEIWITFPDPRLRDRDEKRRLTFHTFLNRYKRILKPGGTLHVKTDSLPFFEFSEESLAANGWETIVKTNKIVAYTSLSNRFAHQMVMERTVYSTITSQWILHHHNFNHLVHSVWTRSKKSN